MSILSQRKMLSANINEIYLLAKRCRLPFLLLNVTRQFAVLFHYLKTIIKRKAGNNSLVLSNSHFLLGLNLTHEVKILTAEIVVMNKNGIALAADSAVTITGASGQKIYNTHKLFMLSKYHPVGVMIFGNAELLGVPWQVMIKEFRKKELGDTHYPTLQEYGDRLIGYINNNHKYFPPEKQNNFFTDSISNVFESISRQITGDVREITVKGRKITATEVSSIIERHILTVYKTLSELEDLTALPKYSYRKILKKYKNDIDAKIQNHFQFLKTTDYLSKILRRISGLLFVKNTFDITGNYSGIVVAGFGEDEIYANVIEYNIDAVINDNLKYFLRQQSVIDQDNPSIVLPFAQHEMVYSFMEGISPNYETTIEEYLRILFTNYPKEIIKQIGGLDSKAKNALLKKMNNATSGLIEQFLRELENWARVNNVLPILGTVAFLPLEELASMAESLVNLTSFKRRVTMEAETVGGPIDVAVISKGDGFIWINRKHYFDAKYNPHFSANYYRG